MLRRIITCSVLLNVITTPNPTVTSCDSIFEKEQIITECANQLGKQIGKKTKQKLSTLEEQSYRYLTEIKNNASLPDSTEYLTAKQQLKAHQNKYLNYLRKKIEKLKKKV